MKKSREVSELLDDLFQNSNIVPTVGFNVEKFKSKSGQCLVEIKMFVLTPLTVSSLHYVTIAPCTCTCTYTLSCVILHLYCTYNVCKLDEHLLLWQLTMWFPVSPWRSPQQIVLIVQSPLQLDLSRKLQMEMEWFHHHVDSHSRGVPN